jgi:hypothetical protein
MKKKNKKIKDNKIKGLLSNQKGIALLTVLIFIFLMVTFVVALLAMTGNDIKISAIQRDSTKAFYQAESGIEQALYNLNVDANYNVLHWRPDSSDPYIKEPFNSLEYYEVTITDIGDPDAEPPELSTDKIKIISTGILTPVGVEHSRKRSIEVLAVIGWNTDVTYKYAVLSEEVIVINGSGPGMPIVEGDMHSNYNIEVNGHFADGYDGTATTSGETNDLDETEEHIHTGVDTIAMPTVDYDELKSRALAVDNPPTDIHYHTSDVILGNGEVRNWTGIHYIEGSLEAKNGSEIHVENGAIIATGDVYVKEGAIFDINNDPINYLDPTDPITALALVAQGNIKIYAKSDIGIGVVQSILPDGTTEGFIELKNGCTVTGSVIADTVFLHNGSTIIYDEANLQKYITQGDPFYKKISWREVY